MVEDANLLRRIEGLEARLGERAAASKPDDRLQRLLRYLPPLFAANLLVGVPALLISLAIAYATFTQAEATTKIQQAEAWPFISYGTSNAGEDGARVISLVLSNDGIGPALLGPIEIRYEGKAIRNPKELLRRCCGYREGMKLSFATSPASGISVRPGESVGFLRLTATAQNEALWQALDQERWKLRVRSCYCSIFGECWIVDGVQSAPQATASCPADWTPYSQGTPADMLGT